MATDDISLNILNIVNSINCSLIQQNFIEHLLYLRHQSKHEAVAINKDKAPALKKISRTSLVVQWLRICLPMQGTRVRALAWEDLTCRRATTEPAL